MRKCSVALALTVFAGIAAAQAQTYPSRSITLVVPFPPGGSTDAAARIMAERMRVSLGQPIVIENVGGAGGSIAVGRVARSAPDGYTFDIGQWDTHVGSIIYKLDYDLEKDFEPIALISNNPQLMVGRNNLPANTLAELVTWMKTNPGKINYGSAGHGTPQNIACELFKMMAGVNLVHVPYRGGAPATTDLLGGHLQVIFSPLSESIEHIKAGKLRALAVTTATRLDVLPDTPTVGDFVPGYEASGFAGIGAPKDTPADIIKLLNKELNAGLADSKIKTRIVELGGTVLGGSPAEFGAILSEAIEKWTRVIKFAGIKVE